jgi:hypothetical protein
MHNLAEHPIWSEKPFYRSPLLMLHSSVYVCPECREEIAPGVTDAAELKSALAGVKFEIIVWDDADWPGEDEPSLWIECPRHDHVLIQAPLGERNVDLIRGRA